jgi:hypothetical protein
MCVMHVNKANTINYPTLGLLVCPLVLWNSYFPMYGALLRFQLVNILTMLVSLMTILSLYGSTLFVKNSKFFFMFSRLPKSR